MSNGPGEKPPELYNNDHEEYVVFARSNDEINRLQVAQKIFKIMGKNCLLIKKISKNMMKIVCRDKQSANDLIKTQPLDGLRLVIPFHMKYVVGVIHDIDVDMNNDQVVELFEGKIKAAYRMNRYDRGRNERVPTKSVKVILEGDRLPEFLEIYGMRVRVSEFTQRPKVCFKCLKYGHFKDKCQSKIEKERCFKCGQFCDSNNCKNEKKCISCGDVNHSFGHSDCSVFKIEEDILRVMNTNRLSYLEAKDWIRENACGDAFKYILKDFPTVQEATKKGRIFKTKAEKNSEISLNIISSVKKLKELREQTSISSRFNQLKSMDVEMELSHKEILKRPAPAVNDDSTTNSSEGEIREYSRGNIVEQHIEIKTSKKNSKKKAIEPITLKKPN